MPGSSTSPTFRRGRSREVTFERDITSRAEIEEHVTRLAVEVTESVVAEGRSVTHVAVKIRTASFFTRTKIGKLVRATTDAADVVRHALVVLDRFDLDRPVRLLGVRVVLDVPAPIGGRWRRRSGHRLSARSVDVDLLAGASAPDQSELSGQVHRDPTPSHSRGTAMNTPTTINHPTSASTDAVLMLDSIGDIVDAALVEIEGALLVSQSRCVDLLLDLYNAAPIGTTRHVIEARLSDIRHLNAVEAAEVRADLYAVLAIAAAESAIEAGGVGDRGCRAYLRPIFPPRPDGSDNYGFARTRPYSSSERCATSSSVEPSS